MSHKIIPSHEDENCLSSYRFCDSGAKSEVFCVRTKQVRPLWSMPTRQESLFEVSQHISVIVDGVIGHVQTATSFTESELLGLVVHLDLLIEQIREINGACA